MKNLTLMSIVFLFSLTVTAQEISSSKPIETFYKSLDQKIQTTSDGQQVVFLFQDGRFNQIDVIESVNFKDKETMQYFFDKVNEVQSAPKTEKTVDLSVIMNEHVLNKKEVKIVRLGSKQFVTYVYVGDAFTIIPKTYLKKLLKKINS